MSGPVGSSPLARGLRREPTAGPPRSWDHPRSRGVYMPSGSSASTSTGSSPLARGLRVDRQDISGGAGIIPARAGFTELAGSKKNFEVGSSPLARGLPRRPGAGAGWVGIIPARAGFTDHRPARSRGRRDHPRSRGVYISAYDELMSTLGSSPLARGLRVLTAKVPGLGRIIPARAGFTEQLPITLIADWGSSPLARGLPVVEH